MAVFLSYDNTKSDGLGAQALRMVGVYSLARLFRLKYVHKELTYISEEFAHYINGSNPSKSFNQFKQLFRLPSNPTPKAFFKEITIEKLDLSTLLRLIVRWHFLSRKNVLISVLLPFQVVDRFPVIYRFAREVLVANLELMCPNRTSRIMVVHARYGYGAVWTPSIAALRRKFLAPSYFSKTINAVCLQLHLPRSEKILVHTDLSPTTQIWKPQHSETIDSYRKVNHNSELNEIVIRGRKLEDELLPPNGYSLEVKYCADFFETFLDMCSAQVLLVGRSAFSYLAAIINMNCVVWPSNHGHTKMPEWLSEKEFGVQITDKDIETFKDWI